VHAEYGQIIKFDVLFDFATCCLYSPDYAYVDVVADILCGLEVAV
jgi:hypothetical protein